MFGVPVGQGVLEVVRAEPLSVSLDVDQGALLPVEIAESTSEGWGFDQDAVTGVDQAGKGFGDEVQRAGADREGPRLVVLALVLERLQCLEPANKRSVPARTCNKTISSETGTRPISRAAGLTPILQRVLQRLPVELQDLALAVRVNRLDRHGHLVERKADWVWLTG